MRFRANALGMCMAFFMFEGLTGVAEDIVITAAASESAVILANENIDTGNDSAENTGTDSSVTENGNSGDKAGEIQAGNTAAETEEMQAGNTAAETEEVQAGNTAAETEEVQAGNMAAETEEIQAGNMAAEADSVTVTEGNRTLRYEIDNQMLESGNRLCDLEYLEYAVAEDGTMVRGTLVWYFPETGGVLDEKLTITGETGEMFVFGWRFLPAAGYQNYEPVAGRIVITIGAAKQTENHVQSTVMYTGTEHTDEAAEQSGNTGANASGQSFGAASVIVVPEGTDLSSLMGSITTGVGALVDTETSDTVKTDSDKTEDASVTPEEETVSREEENSGKSDVLKGSKSEETELSGKTGLICEKSGKKWNPGKTEAPGTVSDTAGTDPETGRAEQEAKNTIADGSGNSDSSGNADKITESTETENAEAENVEAGNAGSENAEPGNAESGNAEPENVGSGNAEAENAETDTFHLWKEKDARAAKRKMWIIFSTKLLSILILLKNGCLSWVHSKIDVCPDLK